VGTDAGAGAPGVAGTEAGPLDLDGAGPSSTWPGTKTAERRIGAAAPGMPLPPALLDERLRVAVSPGEASPRLWWCLLGWSGAAMVDSLCLFIFWLYT